MAKKPTDLSALLNKALAARKLLIEKYVALGIEVARIILERYGKDNEFALIASELKKTHTSPWCGEALGTEFSITVSGTGLLLNIKLPISDVLSMRVLSVINQDNKTNTYSLSHPYHTNCNIPEVVAIKDASEIAKHVCEHIEGDINKIAVGSTSKPVFITEFTDLENMINMLINTDYPVKQS